MPFFGAHMSIAGGLPLAVDRAVAHRCEALQIFTKSSNQWRARPLGRSEVREFRARAARCVDVDPLDEMNLGLLRGLATTRRLAARGPSTRR